MISQTESELVQMPTAIFRDKVNALTDTIYGYLLEHIFIVGIIAAVIFLIIIVLFIRNASVRSRAKRMLPDSTNEWFSWKEFEIWQKEQKE